MIFNNSLAIRKHHWPSAFIKVKAEIELQQFCILQEFLQSRENQNQPCLASPPAAEILWATSEILLEILRVSETTVWASSRAAAERTGILWRTITEQPSVLKGSKRKLRLDQRIYGVCGDEEVREVAVPRDRQTISCKNKFIPVTYTPPPLFVLLWIKDYILSGADSCCEIYYLKYIDWENETFICP